MDLTKQWIANINGVNHQVDFTMKKFSGKNSLTVDGTPVKLQRKLFQAYTGLDQAILIGNKECRFVLKGYNADIAVDGMYIDSKTPYVPIDSLPGWIWIFIIACFIIPFVSMGGAIPIAMAFAGAIACIKIAVSSNFKKQTRLIYCIVITAVDWGLFGILLAAYFNK